MKKVLMLAALFLGTTGMVNAQAAPAGKAEVKEVKKEVRHAKKTAAKAEKKAAAAEVKLEATKAKK